MGNYSSFTTAFLTLVEIEAHWNDVPIVIDQVSTLDVAPEDEFVDAVRRVRVNTRFNNRIRRTSVINYFGQSHDEYKFFATYSHLMDDKDAYIRIVAYHCQSGQRVDASDSWFGNWVLVIPRHLNNVCFPYQLRFYALQTTDDNPEEHQHIVEYAKRCMSTFDKLSWEHIRCALHNL